MSRSKMAIPSPRRGRAVGQMAFEPSPADLSFSSPPHAASSPSHSHHFCPGRHFYVAVDRNQFKMGTLVDLLGVTGRPNLPMVVCCSSRDELDAVCAAVSSLSYISLSFLYSDQSETERSHILENFRQAATEWSQNMISHPLDNEESGAPVQNSIMVVMTDACLPLLASGEQPMLARVLINFELPTKKEIYMRRMSTCMAADGIVINMVVGGEVATLKSLEESCGFVIAEMPINIAEML